ncbi:bifunctional adenosylcobinamide kinase/adenosylcobinamide-phosphate guanylyltransferase [Mycobacterium sp. PS03-16]|uniref:bifunctional adenosylcobinamide kinase/adenosylcobinamide-phosphate guanylyltransferase n=1 Tax=Mycobacterium sp. PS03-16 TaxID=2559611 RepID=UPI001073E5BD|nr:bifunctional adenosylcobinamide kinase/adenosylcobinamide-phosphate guanylyltransferase [Mycobacterium sp. PS03-16]TFV54625.1 bifunctional adenosylcobinamide kinase/adenosylcobinamide-phosphate guanylyltransferase [Mycobacterium sp. PS03-16]
MRVLVTGGVRSGKSGHAESLLAGASGVTYVAPGRPADGSDPDWDARVGLHRSRRQADWVTVETADLGAALRDAAGPVLIDCLGTWVTAVIDGAELWEASSDAVSDAVGAHLDVLCTALRRVPDVVLVTNEVGLGVVPEHRSGRLFRDVLGTVNQRVAAVCDEVHLVIAGRVLTL